MTYDGTNDILLLSSFGSSRDRVSPDVVGFLVYLSLPEWTNTRHDWLLVYKVAQKSCFHDCNCNYKNSHTAVLQLY